MNGIGHGNPVAIIDLGIVFLILTPLTRVITSLFVFIYDLIRELKFVILTMIRPRCDMASGHNDTDHHLPERHRKVLVR